LVTLARFKDLCLDAADALTLAEVWQQLLGARLVDHGDGSARLEPGPGRLPGELIWVDPVPEPRAGGTRVHLDLRLAEPDPAAFVAAGAVVRREPGGDLRWWVLADPEGNEFCAFPPSGGAAPGVLKLVVAAADPAAQAGWWAGVLGGSVGKDGDGASVEGGAGVPWSSWVFDPVPEPKVVKNRMHWDVTLTTDTPDPLVAAGATLHRSPDADIDWWVLTDPEGNEFCAFPPPAD